MARNAGIQFGPLLIGQRCRVRFQAFPYGIQQFRFLIGGKALDLIPQVAHCL